MTLDRSNLSEADVRRFASAHEYDYVLQRTGDTYSLYHIVGGSYASRSIPVLRDTTLDNIAQFMGAFEDDILGDEYYYDDTNYDVLTDEYYNDDE
jgi:hypothetical protein